MSGLPVFELRRETEALKKIPKFSCRHIIIGSFWQSKNLPTSGYKRYSMRKVTFRLSPKCATGLVCPHLLGFRNIFYHKLFLLGHISTLPLLNKRSVFTSSFFVTECKKTPRRPNTYEVIKSQVLVYENCLEA